MAAIGHPALPDHSEHSPWADRVAAFLVGHSTAAIAVILVNFGPAADSRLSAATYGAGFAGAGAGRFLTCGSR